MAEAGSNRPNRGRTRSWREFIRSHLEVLAVVDFFTAEMWTAGGLMTCYLLTLMRVASSEMWLAGITTSPERGWMEQMALNISFADVGLLNGCRHLLNDQDAKFRAAFTGIAKAVGIKAVKLPARSPNLNATMERVVQQGRHLLPSDPDRQHMELHGGLDHQGSQLPSAQLRRRPRMRLWQRQGWVVKPARAVKPYKTTAAAVRKMRAEHPDWLLLRRGDRWQEVLGTLPNGRNGSESAVADLSPAQLAAEKQSNFSD